MLQKELQNPKKLDDNLIRSYLDFMSDAVLHKPQTQKMIINHLIKAVEITKTSVIVLSTFTEVLAKIGWSGDMGFATNPHNKAFSRLNRVITPYF